MIKLPDDMRIQIKTDRIAEKLDEMADICEYWKKHRSKGRTPNAIRGALVYLSQEVSTLNFFDKEAPELFPGTPGRAVGSWEEGGSMNKEDGGPNVKRTERGWAGHFIGGHSCLYRRNTLLECGDYRIVVSTVGGYKYRDKIEPIGTGGRFYETMAFKAKKDGPYWEADVNEQLSFENKWAICADSSDALPNDVDNLADQMHEAVVSELADAMSAGVNQ